MAGLLFYFSTGLAFSAPQDADRQMVGHVTDRRLPDVSLLAQPGVCTLHPPSDFPPINCTDYSHYTMAPDREHQQRLQRRKTGEKKR